METLYQSYGDIPNASELQRVQALCGTARTKLQNKRADVLSESEWNSLEILEPSTAERARELLKQQTTEQQQLHLKQAPAAGAVQLARMQKDEGLDSFFERCGSMAAPLYVVREIYNQTLKSLKDMNQRNKERNARLDALDARLRELEGRPSIKDAGVWHPQTAYRSGDIVSHQGSGWICAADHVAGDGIDHARFRLLVKKGIDGRDAKDAR